MMVCTTKTTGATWIAGRPCSALVSLSTPTSAAAAAATAHAIAGPQWNVLDVVARELVVTPLHANARPAPTIIASGWWRPNAASR